MLTKEEKRKLKQLIKEYSMAEMDVGNAKSIGDLARDDAIKEAVAEAAAKMEVLFTYIDKEIS